MSDQSRRLAVSPVRATGRWCQRSITGAVTLFVEVDEVVVRVESNGEELPVPLLALGGAAWRAQSLTLYQAAEVLQLEANEGLDRAWHVLAQRACALPEVTRGLRSLGGTRGEWPDAHARFFAPLLQARRRLEGDEPLDWKVAGFDSRALAERMHGVIAALTLERHAARPAHRRAFEAGLVDASEPLFRQLERLALAAQAVHDGDDANRFAEWRAWVAQLRTLFVEADRAWAAVIEVLDAEARRA